MKTPKMEISLDVGDFMWVISMSKNFDETHKPQFLRGAQPLYIIQKQPPLEKYFIPRII